MDLDDFIEHQHLAQKMKLYCEECGNILVVREKYDTGSLFWGCSRYPECKYTAKYAANVIKIPKPSYGKVSW